MKKWKSFLFISGVLNGKKLFEYFKRIHTTDHAYFVGVWTYSCDEKYLEDLRRENFRVLIITSCTSTKQNRLDPKYLGIDQLGLALT